MLHSCCIANECGFDRGGFAGVLFGVVEQVAIDVERDRDRAMAHEILDPLRADPLLDPQRCGGMPERVHSLNIHARLIEYRINVFK